MFGEDLKAESLECDKGVDQIDLVNGSNDKKFSKKYDAKEKTAIVYVLDRLDSDYFLSSRVGCTSAISCM